MKHLQALIRFALLSNVVRAAFEISYGSDADLTAFVTRPDIKAPILDTVRYEPDQVAPGYIFVAPYARFYQEQPAASYYEPCQTGPHIYDTDGELVWSGACTVRNKNVADFRPVYFNGSYHLSAIYFGGSHDQFDISTTIGHGYLMDQSYKQEAEVNAPHNMPSFNVHEFRVVDDGRSALIIVNKPEYRDISALGSLAKYADLDEDFHAGWVENQGFQEVDILTGAVLFEWWALDHVSVVDSMVYVDDIEGPPPDAWNYFYMNSVDKNKDGDYLISARHMDTVYCISGKEGSIKWQLGGRTSSFDMQGFNFSRQHDARFLSPQSLPFGTEAGIEYISLLDNAAGEDDEIQADDDSEEDLDSCETAALVIALDKTDMTAQVLQRIPRPGGEMTRFGGNSHLLPGGNLFASWSGDNHISEYDRHGKMVMEARFASDRFTTYRAYKSAFQAAPTERPIIKCFAIGVSAVKATTVCYVSQNGATQVRSWRFREGSSTERAIKGDVTKAGFETRLQFRGYIAKIFVEGLDAEGAVLDASEVVDVEQIQEWAETDTLVVAGHEEL